MNDSETYLCFEHSLKTQCKQTKLAMGAVGVGMQSQQQQRQQQSGGGGSGGLLQQKMAQAKQAKKVMDVGKSLGITPQQALQGAKMAKKAGVL